MPMGGVMPGAPAAAAAPEVSENILVHRSEPSLHSTALPSSLCGHLFLKKGRRSWRWGPNCRVKGHVGEEAVGLKPFRPPPYKLLWCSQHCPNPSHGDPPHLEESSAGSICLCRVDPASKGSLV